MSWLISKALMADYENSLCSQGQVVESLAASCSDGEQSVPSSSSPTPQAYLSPDKMTDYSRLSRFGMMFEPLMDDRGEGLLTWYRGGFPCQDISCAGKGAGIEGERSGLWSEMARIVGEVRPRYVFVENSPMLVGRGLTRVLSDLAALGYDARWGIVGANWVRLPHKRDRLWVVADSTEESRGIIYRWADSEHRNMGKHKPLRSQIDRFVEELEGKGEQRENQGKNCLPPYLCRVDNGMAIELDELKAIGNGQVPQAAALAWRILTKEDI